MSDEKKNKMSSRKFIVWITATLFEASALVYGFIAKDMSLAEQFTPWWGGISMFYIGGNVAQKFIPQKEAMEAQE